MQRRVPTSPLASSSRAATTGDTPTPWKAGESASNARARFRRFSFRFAIRVSPFSVPPSWPATRGAEGVARPGGSSSAQRFRPTTGELEALETWGSPDTACRARECFRADSGGGDAARPVGYAFAVGESGVSVSMLFPQPGPLLRRPMYFVEEDDGDKYGDVEHDGESGAPADAGDSAWRIGFSLLLVPCPWKRSEWDDSTLATDVAGVQAAVAGVPAAAPRGNFRPVSSGGDAKNALFALEDARSEGLDLLLLVVVAEGVPVTSLFLAPPSSRKRWSA